MQSILPKFLDELKTLTDLRSPTSSIDGVNAVASFYINKAKSLNLHHEILPVASDTVAPCLLVSNAPTSCDFDILFLAHMDTVFPLSDTTPFTIDGDIANALGIIDDKAGGLMTFYIIEHLKRNDLKIAILFNSHEETGSTYAKPHIISYASRSRYCFVMEPAREDGSLVATRKGLISYQIDFHGTSAHAGNNPERGASALVEAANFVMHFSKLNDYVKGHTFNTIITNGGTAINVVPDFASLSIEMRYTDSASIEFFDAELRHILSHPIYPTTTHTQTLTSSESPMISPSTEMLKSTFADVARSSGTTISFVNAGGLSDGNYASSTSTITIDGLGPTGGNMHTNSEYMVISSVIPKLELIIKAISRLFP